MSQAGKFSYDGSGNNALLTVIQTDSGSAQADYQGVLFGLGGSNMNTEGVFNSVTVNLDNAITIDQMIVGNLDMQGNTLSSVDVDGNIIFSPDGSGKVKYTNSSGGLDNNAPLVTNASKETITPAVGSFTNGMTLIGSTGSTPVGSTLTAGSGISISNNPGSITISSTGSGSESGGVLNWETINYEDYSQDTQFEMSPNTGYIVRWWGSFSDPTLTLTFPPKENLTFGDVFSVVVLRAASNAGTATSNLYIDPTVNNFQVFAPYIIRGQNPSGIRAPFRPVMSNGGLPSITVAYTGDENNFSNPGIGVLSGIHTMGSWKYMP